MNYAFSGCLLAAFLGGHSVQASTIAYEDPAGQGSQAYNGKLALTFTVNAPPIDVFQAITPPVSGPRLYEVDAVGFSASEPNGNLNTPGGCDLGRYRLSHKHFEYGSPLVFRTLR